MTEIDKEIMPVIEEKVELVTPVTNNPPTIPVTRKDSDHTVVNPSSTNVFEDAYLETGMGTAVGFECPKCLKIEGEPVRFRCAHYFCYKCIESLSQVSHNICPLCNDYFNKMYYFVPDT